MAGNVLVIPAMKTSHLAASAFAVSLALGCTSKVEHAAVGAPGAAVGAPSAAADAADAGVAPGSVGVKDAGTPQPQPQPGQVVDGGPISLPTWAGEQAGLAAFQPGGGFLVVLHDNPTGQQGADSYTLERRTSSQTIDPTFPAVTASLQPVQLAVAGGTIVLLSQGPTGAPLLQELDSAGQPIAGFDGGALAATQGLTLAGVMPGRPWGFAAYDDEYLPKMSTMAVQTDGQVLLLLFESGTGFVSRVTTTGAIDSSFAGGGKLTMDGAMPLDVALLPNGTFVVIWESTSTYSTSPSWYDATGALLGTGDTVYENSFGGLLTRSDGSILVGTGSGAQVTYQAYLAAGAADTASPAVAVSGAAHRFIGADGALDVLPITGPALTLQRTLPSGASEATLNGTIAVDAGTSVTIANAIPRADGATLLLGDECGAVDPTTNVETCTALVAVLGASGGVE
jgi:hypothetical protein